MIRNLLVGAAVLLAATACDPRPATVQQPVPAAPASTSTSKPGPSATPDGFWCADGTHSAAKTRQGACSHHGGVRP